MMQPLLLQSMPLTGRPSLTMTSASPTLLPATQSRFSRPLAQSGGGQFDMFSLLMPLLQVVMQMMQMIMGGQPATAPASSDAGSPQPSPTSTPVASTEEPGPVSGKPASAGGYADNAVTPGASDATDEASPSEEDSSTGSAASMTIAERRAMNYSDLKADPNGGDDYANVRKGKEAFNGVSGRDAAIMHLGGRGHISAGTSANGISGTTRIYNNVLNKPGSFTPDEVALIQQYAADEKARYGMITGSNLDHAFVDQMATRGDISPEKRQAYHEAINARVAKMVNNPDQAAVKQEASQEVNITSDIGTLEKQSGLNRYEQAVYRLAGHSTLFSGDGSIDGDILAVTLGNKNSLDGRSFGNQDTNIDPEALSLLQDDLATDGELNGDALRNANQKVLDKIFLGGPDVTQATVRTESVQQAQQNGRSASQIQQSLQTSANDAIKQFGSFVKDHPVISAVGAGAMAAGAAVCPFLAGTMAVGAGLAAGSKLMSQEAQPAA